MLYNGAQHLSTGVTPNMSFLGHEVVLPTDLFQGAPPLGSDNGTPKEIVDQMLKKAHQYRLVAEQNQLRAIRRNTAHYLNIARTYEPGDLVCAFSESRGDQVPHRKLRSGQDLMCLYVGSTPRWRRLAPCPPRGNHTRPRTSSSTPPNCSSTSVRETDNHMQTPNTFRSSQLRSKPLPRTMQTAG